jgi:hypothetical protein
MNVQYLKLGTSVLAIALATYVFFPVNARHTTATSAQPAAASGAVAKNSRATSAQHKPVRKTAAQAKASELKIEPAKTLRKQQSANRSGPPSKMYGGM